MSNRFKGVSALTVAAVLYGFFGIFSRFIAFNVPFFYQQWTRNVFSSLLLFGIALFYHQWKRVVRKDWVWFVLRAFGGFVGFIALYIGFLKLPISTTYFISYATSTIAGFILGSILFSEKVGKVKGVALAFSLVGVYFVYRFTITSEAAVYLLLPTVGGIGTAVWATFSKKISGIYSNLQLNSIDFAIGAVLAFVVSLILREPLVMPQFTIVWLYLVLFGILFLCTGLLVVYGFSKVEAQIGSLILLLDILVGIILGWLIFQEVPTSLSVLGGVFILFGVTLPQVVPGRTKR